MSTLRTPRAQDIEPQPQATSEPQEPAKAPQTVSPLLISVVGLLIVAAVIMSGVLLRQRPSSEQAAVGVSTPTTLPLTAVPSPTPLPDCVHVTATLLDTISTFERTIQYDQAAANASAAYLNPQVCEENRKDFAQRYLDDSLKALYSQPDSHSREAQQAVVDRYETIVRTAQKYGVEPPNALQVGRDAGETGNFLLALTAYGQSDAFNTADQSLVRSYIDNTYNLGYWYTQKRTSPSFKEGLEYLSTGYHLEQRFHTGQAECWRRLTELLGSDETKWPAPRKTPF